MPTIEITSRVTRRSLMNLSRDALATRVLELMEEVGRVRDRLERAEARAAAAEADLAAFKGCLDRVDAILDANDGHIRRGIEALTKAEPARAWDADLPAVVSPCA